MLNKLLTLQPEWVALVMNILILSRYVWLWREPGKILYWLGACILVSGLLLMKG